MKTLNDKRSMNLYEFFQLRFTLDIIKCLIDDQLNFVVKVRTEKLYYIKKGLFFFARITEISIYSYIDKSKSCYLKIVIYAYFECKCHQ